LQREPTDLARLRPSLSPNLVKVIHKLLARNPDHRYANAAETIVALRAARSGELDRTTEITPPSGLMVVGGEMLERQTTRSAPTAPSKPQPSRLTIVGQPLLDAPERERHESRSKYNDTQEELVRLPKPSSNGLRQIVAALVVVGLLGGGALWFTGRKSQTDSQVAAPVVDPVAPIAPEPASIVSIMSYDPSGNDGEENEALVPLLLDSNPQTNWTTTCYANQYFGSKEFVGLVVQFSAPTTGTLNVYMGNAPWKIDVYTALDSAPPQLAGWGQRITTGNNTKRRGANFIIAQPAQYVLLALREIGKSGMCSGSNPYQGLLSGVTFQAS
jgi:hypothetical protein